MKSIESPNSRICVFTRTSGYQCVKFGPGKFNSAVLTLLGTNIRSCTPVQYELKLMTRTKENSKKRVFTHIDRLNTRNKAENIFSNHFLTST